MSHINRIVIVCSGPVRSLMVALISQLGIQVTIYEKREEFTRDINVKIECNFFRKAHQILKGLKIDDEFFKEMDNSLRNSGNKIVIKDLEKKFKEKAPSTGNVEYKTKEIISFEEARKKHQDENPIVLDCTGAKSKLMVKKFGSNVETW
ncbi:MAG: hypothetical protein PV340_00925 [Wolbachia sp.]|nr:hypothetical protein [Wolbachia sp.]MDD9336179.1 hypothetical protein [Wolbachia sp.]